MKTFTELQRYSLNGETMGSRYTALFYAGARIDTDEVGRHLACAVARVDPQMSTWKPDSDLNRLNAAPEQQWILVPQELATVLSAALRVSQQSGGAFDIAVGDLVNAWGFGPEEPAVREQALATMPPRTRLSASAALVVDTLRYQVRKRAPLHLDLNGIAKGFGVDELARCLEGLASPATWSASIARCAPGASNPMTSAGP